MLFRSLWCIQFVIVAIQFEKEVWQINGSSMTDFGTTLIQSCFDLAEMQHNTYRGP